MSTCPVTTKPQTVDFWERHEKTARLARLTQAAAVLYNGGFGEGSKGRAVALAFELEELVIKRLKEENETRHPS